MEYEQVEQELSGMSGRGLGGVNAGRGSPLPIAKPSRSAGGDGRGEFVWRGEFFEQAILGQLLTQIADACTFVPLARDRVVELSFPFRIRRNLKDESGNVFVDSVPVLQFGDGAAFGIFRIGDEAIAMRENAHIKIGTLHVGQASIDGPLVGSAIVLHGQDIEPEVTQFLVRSPSIFLEIGVSG
jgi:hypothetical protein